VNTASDRVRLRGWPSFSMPINGSAAQGSEDMRSDERPGRWVHACILGRVQKALISDGQTGSVGHDELG